MRPPLVRAAAAAALVWSLAGCGGEAPSDTDPSPTTSESPTESASGSTGEDEPAGDGSGENAGAISITFTGDEVDPAGERVEVEVGSEVVLDITADAPGSLHVHTSPEQEIHYGQGTTSAAVVVDQPGVIEVESHDLGLVVLQLEAR